MTIQTATRPCDRCGATMTTRLRTYTGRVLCTNLDACRRREKRKEPQRPHPEREEAGG